MKLAADLASYEDLKRRIVMDTASFGAVGAFAALQVRPFWRIINAKMQE